MSRIDPVTTPKAYALIACQSNTLDPQSGQWRIHGTFAGMELEKLPALVPELRIGGVVHGLAPLGTDPHSGHLAGVARRS